MCISTKFATTHLHVRSIGDESGGALPAILFLSTLILLSGAALHLAVQVECRISRHGLNRTRARYAADTTASAAWLDLKYGLETFRMPDETTGPMVEMYLDDALSGDPARQLTLLEAAVPGFASKYRPFSLDLPLEGRPFSALDDDTAYRVSYHIEPLDVRGDSVEGAVIRYRSRITSEARCSSGSSTAFAFHRLESTLSLLLARFPHCHWQYELTIDDDEGDDPPFTFHPQHHLGPIRVHGRPGFRGTGFPRSGLPCFNTPLLTSWADPLTVLLDDAADPVFNNGSIFGFHQPGGTSPPGNLARAALGLPPSEDPVLDGSELLETLGLPPETGRPPEGLYAVRNGIIVGGIYVEGDLQALELYHNDGCQCFCLTVGDAGDSVTTLFRVNPQTGRTWVDGELFLQPLNGVIYVEGSVGAVFTGESADGIPPASLAPGYKLTVAASGDIRVTDLLRYASSESGVSMPEFSPPVDGRVLGVYSSGCRADGSYPSTVTPGVPAGILVDAPDDGEGLRLDSTLAVSGLGRGLHLVGECQESQLLIFGSIWLDGGERFDDIRKTIVRYDERFTATAFRPPGWPCANRYEGYFSFRQLIRREDLSPYEIE